MATNRKSGIADEVLDQLLEGRDPATVFEIGGLVDELKKRLAERMLNAEVDHHLGAEAEEEAGNSAKISRPRSARSKAPGFPCGPNNAPQWPDTPLGY